MENCKPRNHVIELHYGCHVDRSNWRRLQLRTRNSQKPYDRWGCHRQMRSTGFWQSTVNAKAAQVLWQGAKRHYRRIGGWRSWPVDRSCRHRFGTSATCSCAYMSCHMSTQVTSTNNTRSLRHGTWTARPQTCDIVYVTASIYKKENALPRIFNVE